MLKYIHATEVPTVFGMQNDETKNAPSNMEAPKEDVYAESA